MGVSELIGLLKRLESCFFNLGRLYFAELLMADTHVEKLDIASEGFSYLSKSSKIESTLLTNFRQKGHKSRWFTALKKLLPEILSLKDKSGIKELQKNILNLINQDLYILSENRKDLLFYQILTTLEFDTKLQYPEQEKSNNLFEIDCIGEEFVEKVLSGPCEVNLDPVFLPTYNICDSKIIEFGDTIEDLVPYFWTLSLREILATELCALSIVEYDNFPLQFYLDYGKQCWDEARHSNIYLNLSISLFSEVKREGNRESQLYKILKDFEKTGKGLPVAKEKNLYEAILNSDLSERLILMNILTEGPAVGRLTKKIRRKICEEFPEIRRSLEFDKYDEMFHARLGPKWLKYLIPIEEERKNKIEDTKLLRGFLLLTSISKYNGEDLSEFAFRVIKS